MASRYKNKWKIHPFYSSEVENLKKRTKKNNNSEIFSEIPKQLSNIKLSKELPFFPPKRKKDSKD